MERLFQTLKQEGAMTPFNFARVVEMATKYVLFEKGLFGNIGYAEVQGTNEGTRGVVKFTRQIIFNPDTEQAVNKEEQAGKVCLPTDDVANVAHLLFIDTFQNVSTDENDLMYIGRCIEKNESEFHAAVGRIKQMLI